MKLEDFIKERNEIDDDLIIFQKDKLSIDSEIALLKREDNDSFEVIENDVKYLYLIEVYIANEFIEGWINHNKSNHSDLQITQRLFDYAINDV